MTKAPFLEDAHLKHLLKVAGISGESPITNIALLYAIYGTGMMLTEVSRLPLSLYLKADGTIKDKPEVTAEFAYTVKARPLYWSSPRVTTAIDKYLEYRVEHKHGIITRKATYHCLDPDSTFSCK